MILNDFLVYIQADYFFFLTYEVMNYQVVFFYLLLWWSNIFIQNILNQQ